MHRTNELMIRRNHSTESGFTLVELVLVLMISGMFFAAAAQSIKLYSVAAKNQKTIENAEMIQEVLYEYFVREGHYPCPAAPDLGPNHPLYGMQQCRAFPNANAYQADRTNCNGIPNGGPATGTIFCPSPATSGARDTDNDGVSDIVLIGTFPFREMSEYIDGLPSTSRTSRFREVHRKDGFGTLFTYAVTESMTQTNPENTTITPARPYDGTIAVEDENGTNLTDPVGAAHYVLLSHGENGRGGYNQDGVLIDDCTVMDLTDPLNPIAIPSPAPGPAPGLGGGLDLELENCNFENAIFIKGIKSMADNSNYIDDITFFKVSESVPVWQVYLGSPPGESYIYNTNEGSAAVGQDNASEKVHVSEGNVVGEGLVIANGYCDGYDPTTCLDPDDLGGSGSDCPSGQAAYAIANGQLVCTEVEWAVPNVTCPIDGTTGSQTYLHAISNTGRITCCLEDGSNCQDYQ